MKVKFFSLSMLAVATQLLGSSENQFAQAVQLNSDNEQLEWLNTILTQVEEAKDAKGAAKAAKSAAKEEKGDKKVAKAVAAAPDKATAKKIQKDADKAKTAKAEEKKALDKNPAVQKAKAAKQEKAINKGEVNPLQSNNGNKAFKCDTKAEPIPELEDPNFTRKLKRMMEEFRTREERIAKLEKEKDELHAKLSYATADPEDVDACDYELEDLVKSI